jgi:hypothetical protein
VDFDEDFMLTNGWPRLFKFLDILFQESRATRRRTALDGMFVWGEEK